MKDSDRLWPALGIGTAILTVVAPYLVLRFAPSPVEVALVVAGVLLLALGVLGFLGTARGHGATFVAIALVLPALMFGTLTYGSLERASTEFESIIGDDDFLEDEFLDESSGDGTYGSDPELDALQDDCLSGDDEACETLFYESPSGSEYEQTALDNGAGG